jgi:hypothetical protein
MRHDHPHVRTTSGLGVALVLAALVLASCSHPATVAPRPPHVAGTPALSISVPLSTVGCTLNDVCVAVGTSSGGATPSAVAEFSTPKGRWLDLLLPAAHSPLIDALACSGSQCLLGGSQPGQDLLWLFTATGHLVSATVAPTGGIGVDALTCDLANCALVDTGASGAPPRFVESGDGGMSWDTPAPLDFAMGDAVTTLACGTVEDCAIGVVSASHTFYLYVTDDAGATWVLQSTPSAWTTLTSLSCAKRRCVALAQIADGSTLVRTTTFTRTWKTVALAAQASSLSCTPTATCLVAGTHTGGSPWLAIVRKRVVTDVRLRYVPTPLVGAACGSKVCAAIGVTTVLSLTSGL